MRSRLRQAVDHDVSERRGRINRRDLLLSGSSLIALAALSPVACFAQASTLSRAVRTSESMEPALSFPAQEQAAERKLADLRAKAGKRPNIVWLLIDDMGYGDPGAFGGGELIGAATPNMDRLAREGLKLTSTYSQPTCTPTRSAILTGRLPVRTGLTRPILAGDRITRNPWADEISLPRLLSDAGYTTVLSGKWHVGETEGMRPHEVGFDEFYGYYPAQKELSQAFDKRRYPDLVLNPERMKMWRDSGGSEALIHGVKGGATRVVQKIESVKDVAEGDRIVKEFTVKKIAELAKGNKPFFLEHAFMKVHSDNHASQAFEGQSSSKYPYKDAVVEVDAYIGEIVKTLDAAGVLENTFIFVTSDNGPDLGQWPDCGFTPFKGSKTTPWEGGVRVPGIAYWKGMITRGRESDGLFDLMDLFNTSLKLAGIADKIPTDRYIDGIDQTSFLLVDDALSKREKVYIWAQTDLMAMRMYEYKIHVKVVELKGDWLWTDMSTITDVGLAPWLFNLYIDPKEAYPVGHRLNAFLAPMAAELKAHAATFKKFPPKNIGLTQ